MFSYLFGSLKGENDDDDVYLYCDEDDVEHDNHDTTKTETTTGFVLKMPEFVATVDNEDDEEKTGSDDGDGAEVAAAAVRKSALQQFLDSSQSFEWLHRAACLERGSLVASVAHVIEYETNQLQFLQQQQQELSATTTTTIETDSSWTRPKKRDVILWKNCQTATAVDHVLEQINSDPRVRAVLGLPTRTSVDVALKTPSKQQQKQHQQQSTFSPLSLVSPLSKWIHTTTTSLSPTLTLLDRQDSLDEAMNKLNLGRSGSEDDNDSKCNEPVDVHEDLIVNVSLLRDCLESFCTELFQQNNVDSRNVADSFDESGVMVLVADPHGVRPAPNGTNVGCCSEESIYRHWADWWKNKLAERKSKTLNNTKSFSVSQQQQGMNDRLLISTIMDQLPINQFHLIWKLLESGQIISAHGGNCVQLLFLQRRPHQPDLLVFVLTSGSSSSIDESTASTTTTDLLVERAVTLFDLRMAKQSLERRIQVADAKALDCWQQAKVAKQVHNNIERATLQLKRRRLYVHQSNMDMKIFLNLETIIHTMESAAQQSAILTVMKQASDALKSLHATKPSSQEQQQAENNENNSRISLTEELETVLDDLAEEKAFSQKLNQVFADHATGSVAIDVDEEDLLKELETLQLQDKNGTNTGGSDSANSGNNAAVPILPSSSSLEELEKSFPTAPIHVLRTGEKQMDQKNREIATA